MVTKNQKLQIYSVIGTTVIVLAAIFFTFSLSEKLTTISFSPETITLPESCSNSEIVAVWDSVFKESSENIIIKNSSDCKIILAYKIVEQKAEIMKIKKTSSSTEINAYAGNFTQNFIEKINNTESNLQLDINKELNLSSSTGNFEMLTRSAEFTTTTQANTEHSKYFKIVNGTWESPKQYFFSFKYNVSNQNVSSDVSKKYKFIMTTIESGSQSCSPSWKSQNESCLPSETQKIYYIDENNCNNETGMPENKTIACDYNQNGIAGNETFIQKLNLNTVKLKINNSELNNSKMYSGIQEVIISEGEKNLIKFNWNFSKPINLMEIKIEKQNASDSFGYLIVNGINASKEITIDKKGSFSNKVCIKNLEIDSLGEISANCNLSNEHLVTCPGTESGFECSRTNNTFTVKGLTNSAVVEFLDSGCVPNWTTSSWSVCTNGQQTRTVTDQNNCGIEVGKPTSTQSCACTPKWECTEWSKCENGERTKTCTDANNCGTTTGKPATVEKCESDTKTILILIVVIVLSLAAVAIFIILHSINKNKIEEGENQNNIPKIPPRPMPPRGTQMRIQQQRFY